MASRRTISCLLTRLETARWRSPTTQTPKLTVPGAQHTLSTRLPQPARLLSRQLSASAYRLDASKSSPSSPVSSEASSQTYDFNTITTLTSSPTPDPHKILIDVREPAELKASGKIPSAINLPLTSSPDFMFLSASEFEDRFGLARPGPDDEVIFYCKAGVRSRAAARLALQAGFGGVVSEYPGSWVDWEKQGGKSEKA